MEEKTLREQLIEYFGCKKVWVDAHDRESAQILADWLAHEIGTHFGTVTVDDTGYWQYFSLYYDDSCGWNDNAYQNRADVRHLGLNIVDLEEFPFHVPGLTCDDFPDVDDLL